MNSCEMMRPRLAPSALRTVISQPRVAVRANTSVATFVHMTASSIRKMPFTTYRMFLQQERFAAGGEWLVRTA